MLCSLNETIKMRNNLPPNGNMISLYRSDHESAVYPECGRDRGEGRVEN